MTSDKPIFLPELASKVSQLKRLERHLKKMKAKHIKLQTHIQSLMGNAEYAYDEEGCVMCTWKFFDKIKLDEERFKIENPALVKQLHELEQQIEEAKQPYTQVIQWRQFRLKP